MAFASVAGAAEPAPPTFVVDEGMQFTFPIPGAPDEGISFLVASTGGPIAGVKVQVREFKDPDGRNRDPGALGAPQDVGTVPPEGTRVSFKPVAAHFALPGDYHVTVALEGTATGDKLAERLVRFVIHRPPPELNIEEVKDQTIELTRFWPMFWPCRCAAASGTAVINLKETSGKGDVLDLAVTGRPLYRQEGKVQAPGRVFVTPSGPVQVPAGRDAPVMLQLANVAEAGTFSTQLSLTSPSLPGGKVVPLKVIVRDWWPWPFLCITLGVVGGFVTHYLAQTARPQQENKLRIIRLRGEVGRYRQLVLKPSKLDALAALAERVRVAEEQNTLGQVAAARIQLDQAEQELNAFARAELADREKVQTALHSLGLQVNAYRQQHQGDATAAETEFLAAAAGQLRDAEGLLANGQGDRAAALVEQIQARFQVVQTQRLNQDAAALRQRLDALAVPPERNQEKAQLVRQLTLVTQQLAQGNLADARQLFATAAADLAALEANPEAAAHAMRLTAAVAAPAPEETRLVATDPPQSRTTDTLLSFELRDPQQLLQAGDTFRWHFGDTGPTVDTAEPRASHQFAEAGDYRVKVQVLRGANREPALERALDITILAGRTQRRREAVGRRIRAIDVLLSVIALGLACLTGLLYLYFGKPFGSLSDYILALLWGFGIDNSVRGFAAIFPRITGSGP